MIKPKSDTCIENYLNSLEEHINLSDSDAQKRLDKHASKALDHIKHAQGHIDEDSHKEVNHIRIALDDLRLQYALGKMEGVEKLEKIEEQLKNSFQKLKNAVRKTKSLAEQENEELSNALHTGWRDLELEINLLYLRLGLAHDAGSEKLATAKDELVEDIKHISELGKEEAEIIGENFSAWCHKVKRSTRKSALKVVQSMEKYLSDNES